MTVVTLTDDNFEQEVTSSEIPVLVDYWATWCGPCKMVGPLVEEIASEYGQRLKVGKIDDLISYRLNYQNFTKLKKTSSIKIDNQSYIIKIFENSLNESENFALIKGNIKKNKNPRVRVISSNIVKNYLMGEKLPNAFSKTISYFKKYKDCVLVFVRDTSLSSISETLKAYKSKRFYEKGANKLIKNYGIGAQIIKLLNIKKMILVTRSKKKVIALDGYGIKITKQEIIK